MFQGQRQSVFRSHAVNTMNRRKVALLYLLYLRRKTRKRNCWVNPVCVDRPIDGVFQTLWWKLRGDEEQFFNFCGMSIATFDELLQKVEVHLMKQDTTLRLSIPPTERLVVTLRYLASGSTLSELHHLFRMGVSTMSGIVEDVCFVIRTVLQDECFPTPTKAHLQTVANGFARKAHFPNCIGAVDGKHIRLMKPKDSPLVLMAVADTDYKFLFVDVGSYGDDEEPSIFENNTFCDAIQNGYLEIPEPKPLTEGQPPVPFVLVGDEAFPLSKNLMRPFGGKWKQHCVKKRAFNYRIAIARRYVECTLGILTNKWHIFHRPMNVKIATAESIVKACCTLHNFVRVRDGYKFEDTLSVTGFESSLASQQPSNKKENAIRMQFANYFVSDEGALPWLMSKT